MSAFDGAGKPFRGPTFRAGIVVLIVCLVAIGLVWLLDSAALNALDPSDPLVSNPMVREP